MANFLTLLPHALKIFMPSSTSLGGEYCSDRLSEEHRVKVVTCVIGQNSPLASPLPLMSMGLWAGSVWTIIP